MVTLEELRKTLKTYRPKQINLSDYPDFSRAAVLLLLFPSAEGFSTILTKRTDLVDTHKGQIAFPGGMAERGDADIVSTALRETREELGIETNKVEVLGILDDLPVPSKFIITPVVGYMQTKQKITPHSVEVAEVFDAPIMFFQNEKNTWVEEREFRGAKRKVWFYSYEGRVVWGATAAILRNLLSVI